MSARFLTRWEISDVDGAIVAIDVVPNRENLDLDHYGGTSWGFIGVTSTRGRATR